MCAKLHPYTEVRCKDREVTAGGTTLEMSLPPPLPERPAAPGGRKQVSATRQRSGVTGEGEVRSRKVVF